MVKKGLAPLVAALVASQMPPHALQLHAIWLNASIVPVTCHQCVRICVSLESCPGRGVGGGRAGGVGQGWGGRAGAGLRDSRLANLAKQTYARHL